MSSDLKTKILSFTAANVSAQVATTLTGIFLARTLSLADLGSYRQVILVVNTVGGVFALGLPLSLFYFVPRLEGEERSRFAGQTLLLLSGLGALAGMLVAGASGLIAARMNNPALQELLRFGAPLLLTGILVKYVAPFFLSVDQAKLAGLFRVIQSFSVSLVLVVLIAKGWPLGPALLAMALAEGASFGVALYLQGRRLPPRFGVWPGLLKPQLAYALPLGLSGVVGLLSRQIDQLFISAWFEPDHFAIYSVGATEIPIVPLLIGSAANVVLPQLALRWADGETGALHDIFRATQRKLSLICIPTVVLFVALSGPLLVFLYGEEFARSRWVFRIYGLIQLNRLFMFGMLLQSLGMPRMVLTGELLFLLLNLVGNYLMLHWIGFLGPAIATELAGLCVMAMYLYKVGTREGVERRQLYDASAIVRILAASGVAGLAAWWVAGRMATPLVSLIAGGVVFVVIVALALLALGVPNESERRWLWPFGGGGRS